MQNAAKKKKIAIVDDVSDIITIYSKALEKAGHQIIFAATSGEEIVQAAKNGELAEVDVVIMDYRMKGIDGLEASKQLLMEKPDLKIIIATGDDGIANFNQLQGVKIQACMIKPIKISKLIESIDRIEDHK